MKNKRYYCTFGSDENYPFSEDEYVVVEAPDINSAHKLFRMVHPNPRPNSANITNCAFVEREDEFNKIKDKYYKDVEPSEIITLTVKEK